MDSESGFFVLFRFFRTGLRGFCLDIRFVSFLKYREKKVIVENIFFKKKNQIPSRLLTDYDKLC